MKFQVRKFDMLVEMINFCKPKIEFEVQHNKTNEAIFKQFMHKFNDWHEEEVGNDTSWKKELEAWILKWNILKSNKSC